MDCNKEANRMYSANFEENGLKAFLRETSNSDGRAISIPLVSISEAIGQNPISVARKIIQDRICFETKGGDIFRVFITEGDGQERLPRLPKQKRQDQDYVSALNVRAAKTSVETEQNTRGFSEARKKVRAMLDVLGRYNTRGRLSPPIRKAVTRSLLRERSITLVQFTCPVINPYKFSSENPEEFIRLSPTESNLFPNLPRLVSLFRSLDKTGTKTKLRLVLGDDDEERYMSDGVIIPSLNKDKFNSRILEYVGLVAQHW